MKIAVVVFPGSNCDIDIYEALHTVCGADVEYVSHKRDNLDGFDAVMLPGGFSYGDYLRCGAIARFANIMPAIVKMADEGKPVFGTCNGFQILTEAGLLPGALKQNDSLKFVCKTVELQVENNKTPFTTKYGEKEQSVLIFSHRKGEKLDDAELMSTLIHELTHSYTRVNGFNKAVMDACRAYIDENGVYHFPNRQEIERAYAEAAAITVERIFRAEMGFRDRDELEGRITIREHQAQDAIYVKNSTGEIKPIDDTGYGYGYWPWIVNKNPESCHYKTFQFVAIPNYMGIGIANGIREQAGM